MSRFPPSRVGASGTGRTPAPSSAAAGGPRATAARPTSSMASAGVYGGGGSSAGSYASAYEALLGDDGPAGPGYSASVPQATARSVAPTGSRVGASSVAAPAASRVAAARSVARPAPAAAPVAAPTRVAAARPPAPSAASRLQRAPPSAWDVGPVATTPCEPAHGRPVLALSVSPRHDMIVSASADHGLRVFSLKHKPGALQRELFTKTAGHKEWVTTCDVFSASGRVISGGMDFAACVWEANSNKCGFIGPFDAPVTKVSADDGTRAMISSMDGSVTLWDCADPQDARLLNQYQGHVEAVNTFKWCSTMCASAERGGPIHIWDVETGSEVQLLTGHSGAVVNTLAFLADTADSEHARGNAGSAFSQSVVPNIVVSGGTDGYMRIFDLRLGKPVSQRRVSAGRLGAGAVTDIAPWGWANTACEARADYAAAEARVMASGVHRAGSQGASSALQPSDYLLAVALTDGAVTLMDPRRSFMSYLSLTGPRAPAMATRVTPQGGHVLATTSDGALFGWSIRGDIPDRAQPRMGEMPSPVASRAPAWGLSASQGPNTEEARAVVRGGTGGRAVTCLEVGADWAVCAGEDGTPLILQMQ